MSNARTGTARAPFHLPPKTPPPTPPSEGNTRGAGSAESHGNLRDLSNHPPNTAYSLFAASELLDIALRAAVDQKSFDVRGLDVSDVANFTDFFLIASGTSAKHVQGIADKIDGELRKRGIKPYSTSGYDNGEWIVLDYGDFVAHVFYEPTRQFYEFDELWTAAIPVELDPQLAQETRALRTGRFR